MSWNDRARPEGPQWKRQGAPRAYEPEGTNNWLINRAVTLYWQNRPSNPNVPVPAETVELSA